MKTCKQCNLTVREALDKCPLCYTTLSGEEEGCTQSYPRTSDFFSRYNLLMRILIFVSIVGCAACLILNFIYPTGYFWSLLIVGGVVYSWAAAMSAIKKRYNIGFNIAIQTLALAVFVVLIDLLTGNHGWGASYASPAVCIAGNLSVTITLMIDHFNLKGYIIYLLMTVAIGFLPLFFLLGAATASWLILVSAAYSGFTLIGAFVFADRATKIELKKRLHL